MEHLELIKGQPYLVKHDTNKQTVRRIFKYTEQRWGNREYHNPNANDLL